MPDVVCAGPGAQSSPAPTALVPAPQRPPGNFAGGFRGAGTFMARDRPPGNFGQPSGSHPCHPRPHRPAPNSRVAPVWDGVGWSDSGDGQSNNHPRPSPFHSNCPARPPAKTRLPSPATAPDRPPANPPRPARHRQPSRRRRTRRTRRFPPHPPLPAASAAQGASAPVVVRNHQNVSLLHSMSMSQRHLTFLCSKTADDIPTCIRGETLSGYSSPTSIASTDGTVVIQAGRDPNSCTSTVAALMLWLCGKLQTLSQVPEDARQHFSLLASLESSDQLLVFHTPFHKFAFLCLDSEACLLHSNQDTFTCAEAVSFSLWDYLKHPRHFSPTELRATFEQLNLALTDPDACRGVYQDLFDVPWKRGNPSDYWFATLPLLPLQDLV